ncbi:MAG: DUF6263 family protein [Prevotellaceae bacterium]|jgi:hypothetical protein|nr:DUF6263 family protein [Prevotellaceae bacterium]
MKNLILKVSTLIVALMVVLPSFSQVTLQYSFKKGEIFKQNMVTKSKITMNQEMNVDMTTDFQTTFEVIDVTEEGYTLEVKYKHINIKTTTSGMDERSFDSNNSENVATLQNLDPMLKAAIDKPIEVVMTKTGKAEVKNIGSLGKAMFGVIDTNIPAARRERLAQWNKQFSEGDFLPQLSFFPDKPVNVGDSWVSKVSKSVPFAMDFDAKVTLRSADEHVAYLEVEGEGKFSNLKQEMEMNNIKYSISYSVSQRGQVKVNRSTGWVISSEIEQHIDGEIEADGKTPISVVETVTMSGN